MDVVNSIKNDKTRGPRLLIWSITPWLMNGSAGWSQQPVILVEGRIPFFADHPTAYIKKLQECHDDSSLVRGAFFACIGQLQDGLEQFWGKA